MARTCELCPPDAETQATVYCPADVCYLCTACDHQVHTANRLARRHVRRPLNSLDLMDHSSINDDSDALVPDVSATATSVSPSPPSNTHQSANDTRPHDPELPSLNDVSVTFEDAAEYDFCFETIGARMPLLIPGDDDQLLTDGKLPKNFYSEMSWDSVVSDAFEHIVPDVEGAVRTDAEGKVVAAWDHAKSRVTSHSTLHVRHIKGEPTQLDPLQFDHVMADAKSHIKKEDVLSSNPSANLTGPKLEPKLESKLEPKREPKLKQKIDTKLDTQRCGKREDKIEDIPITDISQCSEHRDSGTKPVSNAKESAQSQVDSADLQEQRKKRRMEALARFRSKRANRSFAKKVRYECRKQLADSRPRVKGRFVRKVEMALFRKYGAMYRDHLDELNDVSSDQRMATV